MVLTDPGDDKQLGLKAGLDKLEPEHFCSIDEMQAACEAEGWDARYHQINPGRLTAYSRAMDYPDITLLDEVANRCIEVAGTTPVECITVIAPCRGTEIWVNGQSADDERVVLMGSNVESQILTGEANIGSFSRLLSMHIPVPVLQQIGFDIRDHCVENTADGTMTIAARGATGRVLRSLMRKATYDPVQHRFRAEQTSELLTTLIRIASLSRNNFEVSCSHSQTKAPVQVLARAREYIEAHLNKAITMADICAYAGVSLSKLERTFKRELGVTPSNYILARRLSATRRALVRESAHHKQVAGVAMDNGFTHLGRFAGAYNRQFGELPSETLRNHNQ